MGYHTASLWVLWLALGLSDAINVIPGRIRNHGHYVCSTWGNYHFKTFDGDFYQFPGSCSYNLASDCGESYQEFSVHIHRSVVSGHPHIDKITVAIKDVIIQLKSSIVIVNGAIAKTPYYSFGILIHKNDAYFKLYTKTGLTLMWNKEDAVMLELDPKFNNRTCGLCGDYNGVPLYNEFVSGSIILNPIQFGNLQNIHDPNDECTDKDETQKTDTAQCSQFRSVCEQHLRHAAFSDCESILNLENYIQACMLDMCSCDHSQDSFCLCSTITEYSRQCSHAGGRPGNWRTDNFCPKQCPANMIYQESASPCKNSCSHLEIHSLCEEHYMDGCFCPEGTVQDDYTNRGCVPVSQCHCKHRDTLYAPGETMENDCDECHCVAGKWSCTDRSCPGVCAIEGGAHFTTFDGKAYTFHGNCYYVLSKGNSNESHVILGELTPCSSSQRETCLKSVVFLTDNKHNVVTIKTDGSVLFNELKITLPHLTASFSVLQPFENYIILQAIDGLKMQIQLSPTMQLYITREKTAKGQLQGLCGDFNSKEGDDFKTSGGLVEATASAFVNTWKAQASCHDISDWLEDPCSLSIENKNYAEYWCSNLESDESAFAKCHSTIDPTEYVKRCRYDSCSCKDSEHCMCAALSSYVRACAAKGIILWGWKKGICDKDIHSCPSTQVYLYNLTTCQPTCQSLAEGEKGCHTVFTPVDGCGCPDGQYLNEKDQCVDVSKCSCYYQGTHVQPLDVIYKHDERCSCHHGKLICTTQVNETCPAGKVYFDCNKAYLGVSRSTVHRSCKTLGVEYFQTECISGCVCPNGLLDDGAGGCVPEDRCPCVHNEDIYLHGSKVKVDCNTCSCQRGRWTCTNAICYGTCIIYGNGHYITFDEKFYDFDGNCEFVAAQDYCGPNHSEGNFSIIIENIPCGTTGVTCSKSIKVFLGKTVLKLADKHIEVTAGEGVKHVTYLTREVGIYLVIEASNGILLIWDRKTTIFIKVSPAYKGKLCGLCGNFDDNSQNDFKTSHMLPVKDVVEFGNSWKLDASCPDATEIINPCSQNPHRHSWAEKQCGLIKSQVFKVCHSKVDPIPFYEACVNDACSCDSGGDCECFCTAVAAYAQECTKAEACVYWRTPDICPIFCDYYNPEDECEWHYHPCGNHEIQTCRSINNVYTNVTITYLEGCYPSCPEDRPIFDESNRLCVTKEDCGCYINNTHYDKDDPVPSTEPCTSCVCTSEAKLECFYNQSACFCMINGTRYEEGEIVTTEEQSGVCIERRCDNGTEKVIVTVCATTVPTTTSITTVTTTPIVPTTTVIITTPVTTTSPPSTTCVLQKVCNWTEWFDVSKPEDDLGSGDYETYDEIRKHHEVCDVPEQIQCRAENAPDVSLDDLNQVVYCNVSYGLICRNSDQSTGSSLWQKCFNYEIRVDCCDYKCVHSTTPATTTPTTTTSTTTTTTSPTTTPPTTSPTTTPPTTTSPTTTPPTTTSPTTTPPTTTSPTTTPTTTSTVTTTIGETSSESTTPEPTSTSTKTTTTSPTTTSVTTSLPTTVTTTECTTEETAETTPTSTTPDSCDQDCKWSQWFDVSYPKYEPNGGDFETYENIISGGLEVCDQGKRPENISCRAERFPDMTLDQLGQTLTCDVSTGLICYNKDQTGFMPVCYNYEISVYCCRPLPTPLPEHCKSTTSKTTTTTATTTTQSTTTKITTTTETPSPTTTSVTTTPTTTTSESTTPTTTETTTSLTTTPTTTTSESTTPTTTETTTTSETTTPTTVTTTESTTTTKFTTSSATPDSCDQDCRWSQWFDVSYPKYEPNGGDFETYENIISGGLEVCDQGKRPENISCRAERFPDMTLDQLGQTLTCDVSTGLICYNKDQTGFMPVCYNYEISVYCCRPLPTPLPEHCKSTTSKTTTTTATTTAQSTTTKMTTTTETPSPTTTSHTTTTTEITTTSELTSTPESTTPTTTETTTSSVTTTPTTTATESTTPTTTETTTTSLTTTPTTTTTESTTPTTTETTGSVTTTPTTTTTESSTPTTTETATTSLTTTPTTTTTESTTPTTTETTTSVTTTPTTTTPESTTPTTTETTTSLTTTLTTTTTTESTTPTTTETTTTSETTTPTTTTTESTTPTTTETTTTSLTTTPTTTTTKSTTPTTTETTTSVTTTPTTTTTESTTPTTTETTTISLTTTPTTTTTESTTPTTTETTTTSGTTTPTTVTTTESTTTTKFTATSESTTPTPSVTTTRSTTTSPTTTSVTTTLSTTITTTECTTEETEETTPTQSPSTSPTTTTSQTTTTPIITTTPEPSTPTITKTTTTTSVTTTSPTTCYPDCKWSQWFDVSSPKYEPNGGDFETYENIENAGFEVCEGDMRPENISCRATKYPDKPLHQLGQMVTCDISIGLICNNKDLIGYKPVCYNYEISVYCCRPCQTTTYTTTTTTSPTTTTSEWTTTSPTATISETTTTSPTTTTAATTTTSPTTTTSETTTTSPTTTTSETTTVSPTTTTSETTTTSPTTTTTETTTTSLTTTTSETTTPSSTTTTSETTTSPTTTTTATSTTSPTTTNSETTTTSPTTTTSETTTTSPTTTTSETTTSSPTTTTSETTTTSPTTTTSETTTVSPTTTTSETTTTSPTTTTTETTTTSLTTTTSETTTPSSTTTTSETTTSPTTTTTATSTTSPTTTTSETTTTSPTTTTSETTTTSPTTTTSETTTSSPTTTTSETTTTSPTTTTSETTTVSPTTTTSETTTTSPTTTTTETTTTSLTTTTSETTTPSSTTTTSETTTSPTTTTTATSTTSPTTTTSETTTTSPTTTTSETTTTSPTTTTSETTTSSPTTTTSETTTTSPTTTTSETTTVSPTTTTSETTTTSPTTTTSETTSVSPTTTTSETTTSSPTTTTSETTTSSPTTTTSETTTSSPTTTTSETTTSSPTTTTSETTTSSPTTTTSEITTTSPTTTTTTITTSASTTTCYPDCKWSQWFDVSSPKYEPNGGDFETYENIENAGFEVCEGDMRPENISCRATKYPDKPLHQLGQMVTCDVSIGLICNNKDLIGYKPVCYNYEISVYCCRPCLTTTYTTTTTTLPTTTTSEWTTTSPTTTTSETTTTSPTTTTTATTTISPTTTTSETTTTSPTTTTSETTTVSPTTTTSETTTTSPTTTTSETTTVSPTTTTSETTTTSPTTTTTETTSTSPTTTTSETTTTSPTTTTSETTTTSPTTTTSETTTVSPTTTTTETTTTSLTTTTSETTTPSLTTTTSETTTSPTTTTTATSTTSPTTTTSEITTTSPTTTASETTTTSPTTTTSETTTTSVITSTPEPPTSTTTTATTTSVTTSSTTLLTTTTSERTTTSPTTTTSETTTTSPTTKTPTPGVNIGTPPPTSSSTVPKDNVAVESTTLPPTHNVTASIPTSPTTPLTSESTTVSTTTSPTTTSTTTSTTPPTSSTSETTTEYTTPEPTTTSPTTTKSSTSSVTTTPETTTTSGTTIISSTPCVCLYHGTPYPPNQTITNGVVNETCYEVICTKECEVQVNHWNCNSPTTSPTPTTSTPKQTTTTTPTTTSTTKSTTITSMVVSTSKKPGCPFYPYREHNETWYLCNCTMARCLENNTVEIIELKCEPPPKITCANGLQPIAVPDEDLCCWHWECDCVCNGWGDPHYITFDGTYYSFQGNCTYTLVEEIEKKIDNFGVYIDNYDCGAQDRVSCPRDIIVQHESQIIRIKAKTLTPISLQVVINDEIVGLPYKKYGVKVFKSGINYVVEIPELETNITYNGLSFSVKLPYRLFGHNTQGQCGTCTNNKSDDCRLPNGTIISNCEIMADAWIVSDPRKPECSHLRPTVPPKVTVPPTHCKLSPLCDLLLEGPFKECHKTLSPNDFYKACQFDSCHVPNSNIECTSLQQYAFICGDQGVCIDWRSRAPECPLSCPSHKVYKACGPVLSQTCETTPEENAQIATNNRTVEGCFCPAGTMPFSQAVDTCVETCGCVGTDNIPRQFGERFQLNCQDCVCREGGSGITCQEHECKEMKQVTCNLEGFYPEIQINPTDSCCNETMCKCDTKLCSSKSPNCKLGYEVVGSIPDGHCCPVYTCVRKNVCVHGNAEYMPGAPVFSDKCQSCVCAEDGNSPTGLEIKCTHVPCNVECPIGFELRQSTKDCCGVCEQTHCVINYGGTYKLMKPDTTLHAENDNCTVYSCVVLRKQFITSVSQISCPLFNEDLCEPDTIQLLPNGCCKICIEKTSSCHLQTSYDYLVYNNCRSENRVRMARCDGTCGTYSLYSAQARAMSHKCTCCQEVQTSQKHVKLQCSDGSEVDHEYIDVEKCDCINTDCGHEKTSADQTPVRVRRSGKRKSLNLH